MRQSGSIQIRSLRRRTGFAVLFAAVLTLAGGTSTAADDDAKTVLLDESRNGDPVVLILPLNVAVVMPPEFDARSSLVWDAIGDYLAEHPLKLKTVSLESARGLWFKSIQEVRKSETSTRGRYDDAARLFVKELGKHAKFDHVIAPSLYLREASVARGVAEWDGVRRVLEVEAEGAENRRLTATNPFEGVAPAASLHAAVFDAEGNKLQEKVAGLDLIARVVIPRAPDPDTGAKIIDFKSRPDFFGVPGDLREGIAAAFAPFLEPAAE